MLTYGNIKINKLESQSRVGFWSFHSNDNLDLQVFALQCTYRFPYWKM